MKVKKSPTCLMCDQPSEIGNYCKRCKRLRADEQQRERRKRTCMTPGCKNTPSPKARLCTPCFVSIHPRQAAADARSAEQGKGKRLDVLKYVREKGIDYHKLGSRWDKPEWRARMKKYKPNNAGDGVNFSEHQEPSITARMEIIERVEILRLAGRHDEAQALHESHFRTPYRPNPKPARIGVRAAQ